MEIKQQKIVKVINTNMKTMQKFSIPEWLQIIFALSKTVCVRKQSNHTPQGKYVLLRKDKKIK